MHAWLCVCVRACACVRACHNEKAVPETCVYAHMILCVRVWMLGCYGIFEVERVTAW